MKQLTQKQIDRPRRIIPADKFVTGHCREFGGRGFYTRERKNSEPFFTLDPMLKSALKLFALFIVGALCGAALVFEPHEIREFLTTFK